MQTSPATAPEQAPNTLGLPRDTHSIVGPTDRSGGGREMSGGKRARSDRIGLQRAAGIEAKPADPQQRGADDRVGQIVRRHRFAAVAKPAADQQRANQRRDSGTDMHHRAAGEIERSARRPTGQMRRTVVQHAAPPNPMRERTVDERSPQNRENHHRAEFHPLGKRAANQRGRDDEKHSLEQHVRQPRNRLDSVRITGEHRRFRLIRFGIPSSLDAAHARNNRRCRSRD